MQIGDRQYEASSQNQKKSHGNLLLQTFPKIYTHTHTHTDTPPHVYICLYLCTYIQEVYIHKEYIYNICKYTIYITYAKVLIELPYDRGIAIGQQIKTCDRNGFPPLEVFLTDPKHHRLLPLLSINLQNLKIILLYTTGQAPCPGVFGPQKPDSVV